MADEHLNLSDLRGRDYALMIKCPRASDDYSSDGLAQCMEASTLTPEEFVARFGDRPLSGLDKEPCPYCGSHAAEIAVYQKPLSLLSEDAFYTERITTDTLIAFAALAVIALLLFSLSNVLSGEALFVVTASVLITATIIVILLTLFVFVPRVRRVLIDFERNAKEVTLSFLSVCLVLAVFALIVVLLI